MRLGGAASSFRCYKITTCKTMMMPSPSTTTPPPPCLPTPSMTTPATSADGVAPYRRRGGPMAALGAPNAAFRHVDDEPIEGRQEGCRRPDRPNEDKVSCNRRQRRIDGDGEDDAREATVTTTRGRHRRTAEGNYVGRRHIRRARTQCFPPQRRQQRGRRRRARRHEQK